MKKFLLIILLSLQPVLNINLCASDTEWISPNNSNIYFEGARYIKRSEKEVLFRRFSDKILQMDTKKRGFNAKKATGTSGVKILFKTKSSKIKLYFKPNINTLNRGGQFGVYRNGKWFKSFGFNRKTDNISFELYPESEGEITEYEIDLPSFSDVIFLGMEIDKNAKLYSIKKNKKIYVAIGDSITHGTGQKSSSFLTYPFLVAKKINYELYNLAVGGAKVSIPLGKMLKDWKKIDLITILIGYNDLHGGGKSVDEYRNDYNKLLDNIRKYHPNTPIFCINLLFTRKPVSKKTGINIKEFRNVVRTIVNERQKKDKNIYLIEGEKITSEKFLRADRPDPVHLSIKGAKMFADELYKIISQRIQL